jgi:hypothetical protein
MYRFVIVSCDAQTRSFYSEHLQAPQPRDQPMPEGKYDVTRKVRLHSRSLECKQMQLFMQDWSLPC